jgi:hypothetical protein
MPAFSDAGGVARAWDWIERAFAEDREPRAILCASGARLLIYNGNAPEVAPNDVSIVLDELMRCGLVDDQRTLN